MKFSYRSIMLNLKFAKLLFWKLLIICMFQRMPRNNRGPNLMKYVSSSSAKKRKQKDDPCSFCAFISVTRNDFLQHLEASEKCRACYLRTRRCKSFENLTVSLFPCIFCEAEGPFRLHVHLRENRGCKDQYLERFKVSNIRSVFKHLF